MKQKNVIALCLGIIVAGLLWQYYLKPKYDIKTGDEDTEYALHQADLAAVEQAASEISGQLLYKTSDDPFTEEMAAEFGAQVAGDGSALKDDVLSTRSKQQEDFDFSSSANKPRTIFDIAQSEDPKNTQIKVESDGVVMHPTILTDPTAPNADTAGEIGEKDRITMLVMPVEHRVIKAEKDFTAYKKENLESFPKVDFKKNMIVLLESPGGLSNRFFEVVNTDTSGKDIVIEYRVNIFGTAEKGNDKTYAVIKKSNKKIELKQIK